MDTKEIARFFAHLSDVTPKHVINEIPALSGLLIEAEADEGACAFHADAVGEIIPALSGDLDTDFNRGLRGEVEAYMKKYRL